MAGELTFSDSTDYITGTGRRAHAWTSEFQGKTTLFATCTDDVTKLEATVWKDDDASDMQWTLEDGNYSEIEDAHYIAYETDVANLISTYVGTNKGARLDPQDHVMAECIGILLRFLYDRHVGAV